MNAIFLSGRYYEMPAQWNDLSGSQFVRIMDVLTNTLISTEEKKLRLLLILAEISAAKAARILGWIISNPKNIMQLHIQRLSLHTLQRIGRYINRTERMSAAAEEFTAFLFTDITLSKNIIPVVWPGGNLTRTWWKRGPALYGPADEISNMVWAEYIYAESMFEQWKATKEVRFLNHLVSVLYRPAQKGIKTTGPVADIRIPFDPNICHQFVAQIDKWPMALRIAIATMYGSMRQQKITENPKVFSNTEQEENGSSDGNLYGLWSVARMVAKAGHFGVMKDVENTLVDTVLMELNESILEAERQEEHLERLKNNE